MAAPVKLQEIPLPFDLPARPLAILGRHLLLEKDGWVLVDLGSAYARILFEEMKDPSKEKQSLLWPIEADIESPEEVDALQEIGVSCRLIGDKKIAVDALPVSMEPALFHAFFESWRKNPKMEAAATFFCRNLKKRYSLEEGAIFWRRLQKLSRLPL